MSQGNNVTMPSPGFRNSLGALVALTCLCQIICAFTEEEWLSEINNFQMDIRVYSSSMNVGDWAEDYTEDVRILPPGHPAILGKEAYLAEFQSYLSTIGHCTDEITESELVLFSADMAVNRMRFTRQCEDGSTLTGKGVFVLEKVGGKALIKEDIWNYD